MDRGKRAQMIVDAQKIMDKSGAYVWLTNESSALVSRSWLKPAGIPGWIDLQFADFTAA